VKIHSKTLKTQLHLPQSKVEHFDQDDWMKGLGVNVLPKHIDDEAPVNDGQSDINDVFVFIKSVYLSAIYI
jgi:hypothetical protein